MPTLIMCFFPLIVLSASADQVVLKNGDRVTGSIVKKDGAVLTVQTEALGVVTVPWEQVESSKNSTITATF